jgi:hypothetical protein
MTARAARNDAPQAPSPAQAVPEVVLGRAILANGLEFACSASNITIRSADIRAQASVEAGTSLVLYLDGLGLVRGQIAATTHQGFTVELSIIEAMSKRFAARLEWQTGNASRRAELHRAPRIIPLHKSVEVRLGEQIVLPGTILNISMSGAAISLGAHPLPFVRARVRVGSRDATVVRLIERGVAVEFVEPFTASSFNDCVRL